MSHRESESELIAPVKSSTDVARYRASVTRAFDRSRGLLPLTLVIVSLSSLAVVPMWTLSRTGALRHRVATVAEPARAQVTRIQNAIALESAASRAYLLTEDSAAAAQHFNARANRDRAIHALRELAPRLGPDVRATTDVLTRHLEQAEPLLDSLFTARITTRQYLARLPFQQARLQAVLGAATDVDRALGAEVTRALGDARQAEVLGAVLTFIFVVLALIAAALVANLTRQIHESEERFRQIAEALQDFVWLSDARFTRHLFINTAYERIWGRPRADLYRDTGALLEGVHPDDRERVRHALVSLPTRTYDIEFRVVRPNGDVRWVWSRAFPVRDARGEVYRMAGITEDITERKLAAESRVRLIRGFTHDVKNPLGAADGHLALLEDGIGGPIAEQQHDRVVRARRSIRAALSLVTQLLDIARAEAGQIEVQRAPMDVIATAREVMEEFHAQALAKGLDLALDVPEGRDRIAVESDQARVRQILANLLSNAVKYGGNDHGGRIVISARIAKHDDRTGEWATVAVSDNGPGIPYDKQNMLFREFTRFDPSAAQGSGIGLAISQRIARALGAAITFRSTPGEGSTFTLWLPGANGSTDKAGDRRADVSRESIG